MKNIRILIPLLAGLIAASCSKAPADRETFSDILYDLYLIDNSVEVNGYTEKMKYDSTKIYEPVLLEYGMTCEDLIDCFNYYLNDPVELYKVYALTQKKMGDEKNKVQHLFDIEQKLKMRWKRADLAEDIVDPVLEKHDDLRSLRWLLHPSDTTYRRLNIMDSTTYTNYPAHPDWWIFNIDSLGNMPLVTEFDVEKLRKESFGYGKDLEKEKEKENQISTAGEAMLLNGLKTVDGEDKNEPERLNPNYNTIMNYQNVLSNRNNKETLEKMRKKKSDTGRKKLSRDIRKTGKTGRNGNNGI